LSLQLDSFCDEIQKEAMKSACQAIEFTLNDP
jgi:hypothetical protein